MNNNNKFLQEQKRNRLFVYSKMQEYKDRRSNTTVTLSPKPFAKPWTKISYPNIKRTFSFSEDQYKNTQTTSGSIQNKSTKNLFQISSNGKWT